MKKKIAANKVYTLYAYTTQHNTIITLDSSIHFSGLERTWQSSDRQAHTRAITAPLE